MFAISLLLPILGVVLKVTASDGFTEPQPLPPTSTFVATDYEGPYRPQIHFSPPKNFMNDPNGLFLDAEGTYHVYYQYNPTSLTAGNQHWGHATSKDLYHWVNQPIAIYPPTSDTQVFTGSAVIDVNNTSGFFPDRTNGVVAIYTLNTPRAQVQEIAYSDDGGYTFTRYAGNPVIDRNSTQFRDPKVIWHAESRRWVMVVAFSQESVIGIYTSPDLKAWTHSSNFSQLLGVQYECPNMVQLPVRDPNTDERTSDETMYVLTIGRTPSAPLGGSATQYIPGTFNGTHFTPVDNVTRLTDFAKDNYAGQFFYGSSEGGDALSIAWASSPQYAQDLPTAGEGWRSAMSLPRRNFLANVSREGWDLVSLPYDLSPVLGSQLANSADLRDKALVVDYSAVESNALYFEANVLGLPVPASDTDAALNFTFSSPTSGESISGTYLFGGDNLFFLERGHTYGFNNSLFTNNFSTSVPPRSDGTWHISGVVDRSILEVFLNGGIRSATMLFFPTLPLTQMTVSTTGLPANVSVSASVYAIQSAWDGVAQEELTLALEYDADDYSNTSLCSIY